MSEMKHVAPEVQSRYIDQGATENARLENPAPTRRGGKRRNKLYGQPMRQFLQFIEITVSFIL